MDRTEPDVAIVATYAGSPELVDLLDRELASDQVGFSRHRLAIKHLTPCDIAIAAISTYALEEFILKPLIGPIAEKWSAAVRGKLHAVCPFNLTVQVRGKDFIEAPLDTNHRLTARIWKEIRAALSILETENRLDQTSKIRFTPKDGDLLVLWYDNGQPTRIIDLKAGKTKTIQQHQIPREPSVEDWYNEQVRKAYEYREYIRRIRESGDIED